jgi:hypothetical protein
VDWVRRSRQVSWEGQEEEMMDTINMVKKGRSRIASRQRLINLSREEFAHSQLQYRAGPQNRITHSTIPHQQWERKDRDMGVTTRRKRETDSETNINKKCKKKKGE